jgi:hypothetical protein
MYGVSRIEYTYNTLIQYIFQHSSLFTGTLIFRGCSRSNIREYTSSMLKVMY